jgi:NitT/TauT family transport system substrate-binding protein
MEPKLKDAAFVAKMAKFVAASEKGWKWARDNDKEAAKIIIAADTTGAQKLGHQETMMTEIGKLLDPGNGRLDPKDAERTVAELLSGGSDPVITKKPEGAWSHAVYDAMK